MMMRGLLSTLWTISLGTLLMNMGGCATTQPSKFYVLSPLEASFPKTPTDGSKTGLALGIGPIDLPPYLDRSQIVIRATRNELHLSDFHKWAEPLQDSIPRVLGENLSILLSTDRLTLFPWKGSLSFDYQVAVEIIRFDAYMNGETTLEARWQIIEEKDRAVLVIKKSQFRSSAGDAGYEAMVSGLSDNLAELSRTIAKTIKTLKKTNTSPD